MASGNQSIDEGWPKWARIDFDSAGWAAFQNKFDFYYLWIIFLLMLVFLDSAVSLYLRDRELTLQMRDKESKTAKSPSQDTLRDLELHPIIQLPNDHEHQYLSNSNHETPPQADNQEIAHTMRAGVCTTCRTQRGQAQH